MPQQYDMFGGCEEIKEPERKMPDNRYKTMQELHGYSEGHTCGTCGNLLKFEYHDRTYYKCDLWKISHSSATDIRLKNKACGKWRG